MTCKLLAAFAAHKHLDQRRKDTAASPYSHPIPLANVLANEGGVDDEQVLTGAILHGTTVDDLETTIRTELMSTYF